MQFISTGIHAQEMKLKVDVLKQNILVHMYMYIQFWLPSDNLPCAFQDGVKNIKLLTDDKRQKVTRVTQGLKNYVFTAIFVTLPLKKINK